VEMLLNGGGLQTSDLSDSDSSKVECFRKIHINPITIVHYLNSENPYDNIA